MALPHGQFCDSGCTMQLVSEESCISILHTTAWGYKPPLEAASYSSCEGDTLLWPPHYHFLDPLKTSAALPLTIAKTCYTFCNSKSHQLLTAVGLKHLSSTVSINKVRFSVVSINILYNTKLNIFENNTTCKRNTKTCKCTNLTKKIQQVNQNPTHVRQTLKMI